ncbi:hypothetical protein ACFOZ7_22140 [Natribaculum luteum]|uniref:HVO-0234-like beta-propeller domain-containing protein n=1 Tax=Natribaculum luteum TaxID=1586232 RepID=A0ABD5P5L1_9EURY|nr:hypothetical protein [Natribaculum luteum]
MLSIEEKRVYDDRRGAVEAYVASGVGVCWVRVADDIVGEFGLVARCNARDVAAGGETVAVATDEDVRVLALSDADDDATFEPTEFGPAVAVGYDGGDLLAAAPDGRVARRRDDEWLALESPFDGEVRAIDGDLVATADGVYRVRGDALEHAGLSAANDVSAAGVPLAATDDGLYKLGNGWMRERDGRFDVVGADPLSEPGRLERAHAIAGSTVYEHVDGEWLEFAGADEPVVGVGYGDALYAVTEGGIFLAASVDGESDADDAWRSRLLGVTDVSGLAIPLK